MKDRWGKGKEVGSASHRRRANRRSMDVKERERGRAVQGDAYPCIVRVGGQAKRERRGRKLREG